MKAERYKRGETLETPLPAQTLALMALWQSMLCTFLFSFESLQLISNFLIERKETRDEIGNKDLQGCNETKLLLSNMYGYAYLMY